MNRSAPPAESISVRRPRRWDEPMDPLMTASDVQWLSEQTPFCELDPASFPRSVPLDGVLKNDCRLHRVSPGEVIVREGDYANSAFLVLEGRVELLTRPLPAEQLGRDDSETIGWGQALWQFFRRSDFRETRSPDQVRPSGNWQTLESDRGPSAGDSAAGPVLFLQDFDGLVRSGQSVPLGPGELFGEVAAMYRSPRTATVVASQTSTLLEIRWQGLKMLRRDRGFADRMESHYRTHWLPLHLREIPLLRYVPEPNLKRVVEATGLRSFGRMEWNSDYKKTRRLPAAEQIAGEPVVATEGHQVTDLIVVRSGFGRVCQNYGAGQRTTAYLGKGHLFGLEEIVLGTPLQTTLRAVGFLDTLHIPVECFLDDVLPHVRRSELPPAAARAMLQQSAPPPRQRRRQPRADGAPGSDTVPGSGKTPGPGKTPSSDTGFAPPADEAAKETGGDERPVVPPTTESTPDDLPAPTGTRFQSSGLPVQSTGLLEFVVQNRFNNGRQAMVIDLHRCTRCDDCVKACGDVHDGNPRFARVGATHERLQFVQACMQCEDPVCMIGCPTGAIHRDESTGVVRIAEPICIGCGVCANSCPYDNIDMVSIRDRGGRPYTDQSSGKPIQKATKCDMCTGLPSGPACQAACPHDAMVRIDLTESPPLEDWLRRRA